jgi:hypothetical protein
VEARIRVIERPLFTSGAYTSFTAASNRPRCSRQWRCWRAIFRRGGRRWSIQSSRDTNDLFNNRFAECPARALHARVLGSGLSQDWDNQLLTCAADSGASDFTVSSVIVIH